MITDAILSALFGILNAFINLFPEGDAFNFVGTEYVTHPALDMLSLANLFFPVAEIIGVVIFAGSVYGAFMIYKFIRAIIP